MPGQNYSTGFMPVTVSESRGAGKHVKIDVRDTACGKIIVLHSYFLRNGSLSPYMAYDGSGTKEFVAIAGFYKKHLEPENGFCRVEAEPVRDNSRKKIEEELRSGFDGYVLFW